ncbi:MAG: NADH-quinone oxidoreductase subunit J [Nitrospirota bacterium]|jgi:NADH-quinone oxidoreductase subunit J
MSLPEFFFYYHSVVITVLAALVVTRSNPVHSVVLLLVMFFHVAGLYLFLNAEFLAAIQIIVYAGAILVLFLFVVFLLNLRNELMAKIYIIRWPFGLIAVAGILVIIFSGIRSFTLGPLGEYTIQRIVSETHTVAIGKVLYTQFIFPFEVASLLLLVAIVGAVVLAKKQLRT